MKQIWLALVLVVVWPGVALAHPGGLDANGGHTCRTNCEQWGLAYGEYHSHFSDGSYTNSQGDLYNEAGVKIDSVEPSYPHEEVAPDSDVSINPIAEPEPVVITPNPDPQDLPAPIDNSVVIPTPEVVETAPVDQTDAETQPWTSTDTVVLVVILAIIVGVVWLVYRLVKGVIKRSSRH